MMGLKDWFSFQCLAGAVLDNLNNGTELLSKKTTGLASWVRCIGKRYFSSWSCRKKRNSAENTLRRLRRCNSTAKSCKIGSGQSLGVVQHKLARSYSVGSEVADIGVASRK